MKKLVLAIAVLVLSAGAASAQVCVADVVQPANCVANDVRIEEFAVLSVLEDCTEGVVGEAEMILEALVSAAGSPDRYDVGFFVALDGGNALDGQDCLHTYLAPPLTETPSYGDSNLDGIDDILDGPWWDDDGDVCGDIRSNSQVIRSNVQLRFACVDLEGDDGGLDGFVDLSACASWDNNANTVCSGLVDAIPGTASKCGCTVVDIDIPVPVELESFSID